MKQPINTYAGALRRQKIWGVVALAGLFVCGVMIGSVRYGNSSTGRTTKRIAMTDEQCEKIADRIVYVVRGEWNVNAGKTSSEINENLRELNEIYTNNCAGRVVRAEQAKPEPKVEVEPEDTANKETCEVIEGIMLDWLAPETDSRSDVHRSNIDIYQKLLTHGCPENNEKYQKLIQREKEILAALPEPKANVEPEEETCEVIEGIILDRIAPETDSRSDVHRSNIDIYQKLLTHGCPENNEKYQKLIQREKEILAALTGGTTTETEEMKTCAEIENLLTWRMPDARDFFHDRKERAQIYANLSERGCPENKQKYIDLTMRELEVARALQDDDFGSNDRDVHAIYNIYKRIGMDSEAQNFRDKFLHLF